MFKYVYSFSELHCFNTRILIRKRRKYLKIRFEGHSTFIRLNFYYRLSDSLNNRMNYNFSQQKVLPISLN